MAEAFLQILIDNLSSFIREELGLFFGFKEEFKKLSSRFTKIQAVLEDAQEKQLKDKSIKDWLQKLNIAAYEVDDILDECKTKATRLKQSECGSYHPKVIRFRHKIGKRMKEVMKRLDAIAQERRDFDLNEMDTERQATRRETGFVVTEPQVYGRDNEKDEIVKILINNVNVAQELPVLPIHGMGGLGKTTLAQMVYNDPRVTDHFYPKIWVCVSDDFDEKRLIRAIVKSIDEKSSHDVNNLAPLQKKLQELLNGKRYFLVLDDVWNEDQEKWANLRAVLKVGASGASILVTTHPEKVGSIMGTLPPCQLTNLSQEDCRMLFTQRAFGHQEEINPKLVPIGEEIVEKCRGVPLAAKILGGLLRFKREEREWEHIRDNEIWNLPQDENSILPALRLSYHHLPLDLRQCFAYCAVFQKDTRIAKEKLISLWMAHGFLLSKGNLELEDVGNEVWKELYFRSFFQEVEEDKSNGKTFFKMHDLVHDLATSLFSASTSSSNIRETNLKNCYNDMMSIGFAELVSSYSPSLLKKFVSLRVLNLSGSGIKQLPSSIGDLVHLRYLDLSHNMDICCLPKRLCKLQNLQTLSLNYCRKLSCLPKQTSKLCSLRNLFLYGCDELTCMPPRIGSLTCLKTLDRFVVGKKKGYQLGELQNLDLCGSISITNLDRVKNFKEAEEANLSAKVNLHSLSMEWDKDGPHIYESEEVKVLEALRPHPNLKSLVVIGFRGFHLPDWMNHSGLERVISIQISDCKNCSRLPHFGELPCLENLNLHFGSAEVEYVEEDDVHSGLPPRTRFPSLRKLGIWAFPNLKGLLKKEGEEQFPMLEEMTIWYCPMFVFPALSSVKKLKIWGELDATGLSSISNLNTLTSLQIQINDTLTSLPEEMFKSLANLKYLSISLYENLKELPTSLASLSALKCLEIDYCNALESLPEEGLQGLISLTELSLDNCEMLKSLPEGLEHLTALTSLTVVDCPELKRRCERGIGEDWHKIAHIPNVIFSRVLCL
ncbi:putative disease resistance protein RGA3 [Lycium barbarum]|uniref:putative disease resistance protein RGA3 n=1 Tax=Lycium barbarum TaxID=112863 RepID=UPI00293E7E4B|nr:putative disease resistance protein RGA3 [Lycium barbarum]XP_060207755.1 putative disease resistance protein RGA3 [Lycium barbarum]XP_060207756.1 putative disease resistance protein RGA3 [Lycium barbarum]XP_060207757.1 putative disease resistance protein RGA3 [Lycium barbarum]XP_060207759.1 putative disease resistance protein RGA3 [Lycium barbarum]